MDGLHTLVEIWPFVQGEMAWQILTWSIWDRIGPPSTI